MVLPDSDRVSRAPPYSRTAPEARWLVLTGLSPALVRLSNRLLLPIEFVTSAAGFGPQMAAVRPRRRNARMLARRRFRLFPFRSPLLRESRLMSVPAATEMFQFTACARTGYGFTGTYVPMTARGLPHSEILGSSLVSSSPKLFAACYVLRRL